MWLAQETENQQLQAAMQPATALPSAPGEVAGAMWDSFWSEDSSLSSDLMKNQAWEVVNQRAGQKVWDLNSEDIDSLAIRKGSRLLAADELAWQKIRELKKANPALDLPETDDDMMDIVRGLADETKARSEKMQANASGWGMAAGYGATMAGAVLDPVNLATLPLGAGAGGLARTMLVEAAIGAGVESLNQVGVSNWKQQIGRDYGAADVAENIAFAGAGQGLLAGMLHGAGSLWRMWRGKTNAVTPAPDAGLKAAAGSSPDAAAVAGLSPADIPPDVQAAAHVVSRDALAAESVPLTVDQLAHRELLDAAERALVTQERGQLERAYEQVNVNPDGDPWAPVVEITTADMQQALVARGGFKNLNSLEISRRGWGLVKVIWKHGEKSPEDPSLRVSKDDVLALPSVLKDYLPIQPEHPAGPTWIVEHEGRRVAYGFGEVDGNKPVLVTVHVLQPASDKWALGLSGKREVVSEASVVSAGHRSNDTAPVSSQSFAEGHTETTLNEGMPSPPRLQPDFRPLPDSLKAEGRKPMSLLGFIKSRNGIQDVTGDLKAMGGTELPTLIRRKGMHPDDAALKAWEAGYFPEFSERPTINDLYEAIRAELGGDKRYRPDELATVERQAAAQARREEVADLLGSVDAARGMAEADLQDALDIARVRRLWPEKDLPISDREALGMVDEAAAYGRDLDDVIEEAAAARVALSRSPEVPRLHPDYEEAIPFEPTPWMDDAFADDSLWRDAQVSMLEHPETTMWDDLGGEINWNDAWQGIEDELAFGRDVAACMLGGAP